MFALIRNTQAQHMKIVLKSNVAQVYELKIIAL